MESGRKGGEMKKTPIIRIPTALNLLQDGRGEGEEGYGMRVIVTADEVSANPPSHLPYYADQSDPEAMVRVRRPLSSQQHVTGRGDSDALTRPDNTCREGSGGAVTPVADLLTTDGLDMLDTQVEAVPVERRFYNQWARIPREEDPDRDVSTGTRRPASLRMLPATGSLKSYILMSAIARDQNCPVDNFSTLFQTLTTRGAGMEADTATQTDPPVKRNGAPKSASTPVRESENLPPLPDTRAKTALGTVHPDNHHPVYSVLQPSVSVRGDGGASDCLSTSGCEDSLSYCSSGERFGIPKFRTRNYRSMTSARSRTKSWDRQKSLSLNVASLLFSNDETRKTGNRHRIIHKGMKRNSQNKQEYQAKEKGNQLNEETAKGNKHGGKVTAKPPEVTAVQFIDLSEVKNILNKDRKAPGLGDNLSPVVDRTECTSASSRRQTVSSAAQRHYGGKSFGKLYESNSANGSVSLNLPLNISSVKYSTE